MTAEEMVERGAASKNASYKQRKGIGDKRD